MKNRLAWFAFGVLFLVAVETLRGYLIMPFPGSQRSSYVGIAYILNRYAWAFQLLGLAALLPALRFDFLQGTWLIRIALVVPLLAWGGVFYFTNYVVVAEKMFEQPRHTILAVATENRVSPERLVIGIVREGEAKAYPIEFIGHHHQVQDVLAGTPVLVTYCTVCRTGRVFSPVVDGRHERFRLVGMDLFNAMIEDGTTKSWWRQATGEAVAGPRKGRRLEEIPSEQMALGAWLERHPESRVMQPDPEFSEAYRGLRGFDDGTRGGALTGRSTEAWQRKSWVVGVTNGRLFGIPGLAREGFGGVNVRAYDWNDLKRLRTINDRLGDLPIVLWISPDGISFSVRNRKVGTQELTFARDTVRNVLRDLETGSVWDEGGTCTEGALLGTRLPHVQAYQEFWHSWQSFHPETDRYLP